VLSLVRENLRPDAGGPVAELTFSIGDTPKARKQNPRERRNLGKLLTGEKTRLDVSGAHYLTLPI
jgi:hypothetical protein